MKKIGWLLQAAVFYSFTWLFAYLPAPAADRLGQLVGRGIGLVLRSRWHIAVDNIRQALPFMTASPHWHYHTTDPEEIARQVFRNIGRSLAETCRLYHGRGDALIASIEVRGREHYLAARAKGTGLIFLTGHCGNWELLALAFSSIFGEGMTALARRQNNPYLNRMVEKMRIRYKSRVIYKQGALKGMLAALKRAELIGILADQAVFAEEGVLIDVMGRKAWASKAPVIIAQKSGSPLIPTFIHREGMRQIITFYPEHRFSGDMSNEGIVRETQALSRYVENYVIANPTQWYWVHRRWKRAGERAL